MRRRPKNSSIWLVGRSPGPEEASAMACAAPNLSAYGGLSVTAARNQSRKDYRPLVRAFFANNTTSGILCVECLNDLRP